MDINQWLDDTAAAGRPTKSRPIVMHAESVAVPALKRNPVHDHAREKSQRRRRSNVSSSFLEPEESSSRPTQGLGQVKAKEHAVGETEDERSSAVAARLSENNDIDPYCRKKRRKTRADKYEQKSKHRRQAHTTGSSPNRRTAKHSRHRRMGKSKVIKGKTATAVVQTFNAPNVQRKRITLHQGTNPGLFRKGRAGSPFRARGIPDLVFSETSFLQKRNGLHDAATLADNARGGRSRTKNRQDEEEISAYFTPARPPSRAGDVNHARRIQKYHGQDENDLQIKDVRRRGSDPKPKRLPAHMNDNNSSPKQGDPASGTYYSWSTSVRSMTRTRGLTGCSIASRAGLAKVQPSAAQKFVHIPATQAQEPSYTNGGAQKMANSSTSSVHDESKESRSKVPLPCIGRAKSRPKQGNVLRKPVSEPEAGHNVSKSNDMTTESLPLPSTPPQIIEERLKVNQISTEHESEMLLPSKRHSEQQNRLMPSSSPFRGLLADCHAAFQRSRQAECEENAAEGTESADLARGEIRCDSTYGNGDSDQDHSSTEDVRRLWRTNAPLRPAVQRYAAPLIEHPVPVLLTFDEDVESDFDRAIDHDEGANTYGNDDQGFLSSSAYIDDVYAEEDLIENGSEASFDDEGMLDPNRSFWQPNILY